MAKKARAVPQLFDGVRIAVSRGEPDEFRVTTGKGNELDVAGLRHYAVLDVGQVVAGVIERLAGEGGGRVGFGLAAKAAGLTEKQLRNWLDQGLVALRGDPHRGEGGWRRFALSDLIVLAVAGVLVRYGVGVSDAGALTTNLLRPQLMLVDLNEGPNAR